MKHAHKIAHPSATPKAVRLITASPGWPAAKRWRERTLRTLPMMVCGREKSQMTRRGSRIPRGESGEEEDEEDEEEACSGVGGSESMREGARSGVRAGRGDRCGEACL
mmetsp:Transcript_11281/g.22347  ORF Transcript_11281/g.22347 Transcript_11281/m.22347 type:complete len:108 (-) Transcript_11281:182-505(-)